MSQLSDLFLSKLKIAAPSRSDHCGRYAPSPTGSLHLGNLRTALLAWLQARLSNGRFILRIEDLDIPRTRPGCTEQIVDDLKWLGLDWDEGPDVGGPYGPYIQSQRFAIYQHAIDLLREHALLFPCTCSRKDIAQAASAPHAGEQRLVYPGTCRPERGEGKTNHTGQTALRFLTPARTLTVEDKLLGIKTFDLQNDIGDFVIQRADRLFSYQLAVSLDDALMGVTDVVRGADLFDSTAQQVLLLNTFGFPVPDYWHVPLVMDQTTGKRLAKRDGALSVSAYREQGIDAPSLIGQMAAGLGMIDAGQRLSAQELREELTLDRLVDGLKRNAERVSEACSQIQ